MSSLHLRRRRRRSGGQSLVEMSLIAPALVALAAGCGQVGIIAYGAASVETSARAAARVAAEYPNRSLDFVVTLERNSYTCGQSPSDSLTEGSVCAAAKSAAGLLSGSALTITITSSTSISRVPDDVVQIGSGNGSCTGSIQETGTISGLPTGTVATISSPSQTSGSVLSGSSGTYSICLAAPSKHVDTTTTSLNATAVDALGCTYSTSMSVTLTYSGTVTPSPANMTLPTTGVCPTAQPSPTPTPTPTPTATPGSGWQSGPLPTPAPAAACSAQVSDTSFVQVTVSYNAPVFVPIVGKYFESSPGSGTRTVSATQRMQVEPCAVTQGG